MHICGANNIENRDDALFGQKPTNILLELEPV